MNKKLKLKLMALSSLFISNYIFASGPPEVPFQSLFIEGEYSTAYPSNRIYANGRMQAEADIFYQLKEGYTFIGADLKELYSGQSFENTVVSDGYNGYTKDIRLGSGATALSLTSSSTSTLSTTQVVRKYLSSSSAGIIQVCVEAQARNDSTSEIITQSTCEGTTNNASISIEKLSPTNFSLSNFIASIGEGDWTDDWIIHAYTYQPQGFTLRRVWDENGHSLSSINNLLSLSGISYAPYKLLASYQPDRPYLPAQSHLNGSSTLYWIENDVVTSRLEFPYHNLSYYEYTPPPAEFYIKHPFDYNFNTRENITFVVTYGGIYTGDYRDSSHNYASMGHFFPDVIGQGLLQDTD
ncbi:hypothetical protein, partial [Microbulbifer sp. TYP-18]|uniref:hypothetical protein n=1 Tax=Microbulbifer sp. TYP-18 TaxID=3230024 RepID=UPI0034C6DAFB